MCMPGHREHLEPVAERVAVRGDLLLPDEPEGGRVEQQRRDAAQRLRRRRRRHDLAVDRHDRRLGRAATEPAVLLRLEVLLGVALGVRARRECARIEALLHVLLDRCDGAARQLGLGEILRRAGQRLDRRVEQHGAAHALRMRRRKLEHEPAAPRVADPVRPLHPERRGRLDEVAEVRRDRPRRLPARAAVTAQVRRDHAATGPALLREAAEALAVAGHAVQADDRRGSGIAPFVNVQQHRAEG